MHKTFTLLTLLVASLFMPSWLSAQCTPDYSHTSPGIFPDTATNLPLAVATVPYTTVITFVIPHDTNISGFIFPIDSIGVLNVMGLPTGFHYYPNTASGYWRGDSTGCILIEGMPLQAEVGVHNLEVAVIGKAGGITAGDTIIGYRIEILDSIYASIPEFIGKEGIWLYPNPASHSVNLVMEFARPEQGHVTIFNSIGQVMTSIIVEPKELKVEMLTDEYPAGAYFVTYRSNSYHYQKTLMVTR